MACYERVHATAGPHPDCPLTECIRTGKGVTRELMDTVNGRLTVTVSPFKGRFDGERLYLHLTHMG